MNNTIQNGIYYSNGNKGTFYARCNVIIIVLHGTLHHSLVVLHTSYIMRYDQTKNELENTHFFSLFLNVI